jgi:hypothetical protein
VSTMTDGVKAAVGPSERRAPAAKDEEVPQASPDTGMAMAGGTMRSGGNGRSADRDSGEGLPPLASYRSASTSNRRLMKGSALPASSRTRWAIAQ